MENANSAAGKLPASGSKFIPAIFIALLFLPSVSALLINEIHPRAPEWAEIYNPENADINLSEWKIKDNSTNLPDEITCWNITGCSLITHATYFLILGRNTLISDITTQSIEYYYVDDQLIGNGLNDNGDNITIFNLTYSSSLDYNSSQANLSIARLPDGAENIIFCQNPTPSEKNDCQPNQTSEPENSTNNQANPQDVSNQTPDQTEKNETQQPKHDYEYFAENIPNIITDSNLNFTITIRIKNNKNESKAFDAWSYVYRANKCYSQDREANKMQIIVNPNQENSISLWNQLNISEIDENGEYKFKIKILRTEIKTPAELTYNITINITIQQKAKANKTSIIAENKTITAKTIANTSEKEEFLNNQNLSQYESKSEKTKKTAAYIFAATCLIFISYLFFKNRNHGENREH